MADLGTREGGRAAWNGLLRMLSHLTTVKRWLIVNALCSNSPLSRQLREPHYFRVEPFLKMNIHSSDSSRAKLEIGIDDKLCHLNSSYFNTLSSPISTICPYLIFHRVINVERSTMAKPWLWTDKYAVLKLPWEMGRKLAIKRSWNRADLSLRA